MISKFISPQLEAIGSLASCLNAGAHWQRAVDLFNNIKSDVKNKQRNFQNSPKFPNPQTSNSAPQTHDTGLADFVAAHAIAACGRAGKHDKAFLLFTQAKNAKLRLGSPTYNAIIASASKARKWEEALTLLTTALAESSLAGSKPNILSLQRGVASLVIALGKIAQWETAAEILGDFPELSQAIDVKNSMISCLSLSSQWERSLSMFKTLDQSKLRPNLLTYTTILLPMAKIEGWCAALRVLDQAYNYYLDSRSGTFPLVLGAYFTAIGRTGNKEAIEAALSRFEDMLMNNKAALSAAITALAKLNNPKSALKLLKRAAKGGLQMDLKLLNIAAHCYAACDKWQNALDILSTDSLSKRDLYPNVYTVAIRANSALKGKHWSLTLEYLNAHYQTLSRTRALPSILAALKLKALLLSPNEYEAAKCFEFYFSSHGGLYKPSISILAHSLVGFADKHSYHLAVELAEQIKKNSMKFSNSTLAAFFNAAQQLGRWEQSLDILSYVKDSQGDPDLDPSDINATIMSAMRRGYAWERCIGVLKGLEREERTLLMYRLAAGASVGTATYKTELVDWIQNEVSEEIPEIRDDRVIRRLLATAKAAANPEG